MSEVKFEIIKHLFTLESSAGSYKKELNLVSWNGAEAKYDLRPWSEDHTKMGKGITLTNEEFEELKNKIMEE